MKPYVAWTALGALALGFLAPAQAAAWDLFRSPNSHVEEGNEALAAGNAELALEAYEKAARELPGRADVHLDRGLALSALGRLDEAREAFDLAARSKAEPKVRSEAYYNLGRTYLEQANAQADAGELDSAQSQLEESRDALRQALRSQPGFDDAAWNLELVQRRLVELEKERERQKQEEQQKNDEEQQKQDQESSDGEPSDEQNEGGQGEQDPPEQGDSDEGDGEQDPSSGQDGGAKDAPDGGAEDPQSGEQDAGTDGGAQPQPEGADAGAPTQPEPRERDRPQTPQPSDPNQGEALPQHVQQVLDALQDGEETMQRHQARTRAQQRPHRVKKDW